MRKLITLLCFFPLLAITASAIATDLPIVVDPMINATPPGSKVTAGYMTLTNNTDTDITITGASSPTIPKVEIHLSSMKNDVASMEKQESVTVKAGESLEFKHGSYHLMLMELTEPLAEEQSVDIIIDSSVGQFLIEMPVKKIGAAMHKHDDTEKGHDIKHTNMEQVDEGTLNDGQAEHAEQQHMTKDGDDHKETTKVVH